MKVSMGPYPSSLTAYGVAERILFFLDEEHRAVDWLADRLSYPSILWLMETYNDWRGDRRISVRIDPWDSWNADHTLATIALPLLVQLQSTKQGSPWVEDEDVPEELRLGDVDWGELSPEQDKLVHRRWDWILSEIIWALEQVVDDDATDQFYDWGPDGFEPGQSLRESLDQLKVDREGLEAHEKRVANGLRLLGTYWQGLWD